MKKILSLIMLLATLSAHAAYFNTVQIEDVNGDVFGPTISSGGVNTIPVAIAATNYVVSTNNSSTAQLAAGATFTGTPENAFNQPSYSILITSDQPGIVTMDQCIDSACAYIAQTLTYPYVASQGFARSGVINGNYFRLKFKNTGSSTTTALRIDVAYGSIQPATQLNNLPVSINEYNPPNTYRVAGTGFSFANSATDVLTIQGSSTKVVSVQGLNFMCNVNNAGYFDVLIAKRSTANSGGTSTVRSGVPMNSTNPASTATIRTYTANPTLGTLVGYVSAYKDFWDTSTSNSGGSDGHEGNLNFGREGLRQPIVLNNANESVSIYMNGQTISGNTCTWWVEWVEF